MIAATEPAVAVDIGGTKIAAARIVEAEVLERRTMPTPRDGSGDSIVAAVAGLVTGWLAPGQSVGIATTGLVARGRVDAINPATLPLPRFYPLAQRLGQALDGACVRLLNDAHAAAWGEYRFGAGAGARCMAFVTVSTGIGGGLVEGGRLVTGPTGLAGHLGHRVSDPVGPVCGCGRRGCLEAVASGSALKVFATAAAGREVAAPELMALAAAGEGWAQGIVDRAARWLASSFGDLRALFDVEQVVMGGGVGLAPGFLPRVQAHLDRDLPAAFQVTLRAAYLGADAGLVGVADLVAETQSKASPAN